MSTNLTIRKEEMNLFHSMATQFAKAGAFPNKTPEHLFVLMKAGQEMGMSEVESLNGLYISKGKVEPYGKALVALMTREGFQMSYEDETDTGVTVIAKKGDHVIKETVKANDPILQRSNAMKISKKHKMRYHGIRMILNFHLAHLIGSVSDIDEVYVQDLKDGEYEKVEQEVLPAADPVKVKEDLINILTKEDLSQYYDALRSTHSITVEIDQIVNQRQVEIIRSEKKSTPQPQEQASTEGEPETSENNGLEFEMTEESIKAFLEKIDDTDRLRALYKDLSKQKEAKPFLPLIISRNKQLSHV